MLKKMFQVGHTIGASLEHFDLVVEAFHKATRLALHKIIEDLIPPTSECIDKMIEAT